MSLYTTDSIERVKQVVDMVELVSARTDLRRVGTRFTGLCPFHDERTPSFSVNAEHGLYHCFGCGASGDAIRFVQETEGLDFKASVELLAERSGTRLERENEDPRAEERRRRRERLQGLVERAAAFYARFLWEAAEASPAREYLASRGLEEKVLREFRVGYSPKPWDRIVLAAQRDGFSVEEVAAAGLGRRGRQGGFYDAFRGRIMFPLADRNGRVRGFGARALRDDQGAKYVNTSENDLFQKGSQLFGLDRARGAAAKAGHVIVVEGYTDVLALHQAGITEVVAAMGTSLTEQQMAALSWAAKTVYLALDPDSAGQDAMLRAARAAQKRDLELLVIDLPEGSDPADLVARAGVDEFTRARDRAIGVPEFEVRRVIADVDPEKPREVDAALQRVRPIVGAVPRDTKTWLELVRFVSNRLDVPEHLVTQPAPQATVAPSAPAAGRPGGNGRPDVDLMRKRERVFMSMCLAERAAGRGYLERLSDQHLSSAVLREARDWIGAHFEDPLAELPDDASVSAAVTEIAMGADDQVPSPTTLELTFLDLESRRIDRALRHAGQEGDAAAQRSLVTEREAVRARVDELLGGEL
ncbi:MAG: DNA primase [Thermoleophilaceae bacterium]